MVKHSRRKPELAGAYGLPGNVIRLATQVCAEAFSRLRYLRGRIPGPPTKPRPAQAYSPRRTPRTQRANKGNLGFRNSDSGFETQHVDCRPMGPAHTIPVGCCISEATGVSSAARPSLFPSSQPRARECHRQISCLTTVDRGGTFPLNFVVRLPLSPPQASSPRLLAAVTAHGSRCIGARGASSRPISSLK